VQPILVSRAKLFGKPFCCFLEVVGGNSVKVHTQIRSVVASASCFAAWHIHRQKHRQGRIKDGEPVRIPSVCVGLFPNRVERTA